VTDERDLLRAVFATPDDDLPRLVLADWWDEHGQPERAEFVRLAIALDDQTDTGWSARRIGDVMDRLAHLHRASLGLWGMRGAGRITWASYISPTLFFDHIVHPHNPAQLFRRGFVESVRLPLSALLGETCERCGGEGEFRQGYVRYHAFGRDDTRTVTKCVGCSGTGRVGGCAAELFASQPVVRVEVTASDEPVILNAVMFPELFHVRFGVRRMLGNPPKLERDFDSRAAAVDALSAALVQWGRQLAGLTALPSPERTARTRADIPG